jgi:glucosamine-6-phosphate deaminase
MRVVVASADALGEIAAAIVRDGVEDGTIRVLGVATGSSPLPLYRALAADRPRGLDAVELFALDEYVGLPPGHPESYRTFLEREVVAPLGLDGARLHVLDGAAPDAVAECARFERSIRAAGGVDLQILGIGSNGHIGFNEPGTPPESRTRLAELARRTREDNARFFPSLSDVPTHCLTQGLGTILEARRIVLVASGAGKADAIARTVEGRPDAATPASFLHDHPDVTLVIDESAASRLTHPPQRTPAHEGASDD